MGAVVNRMYLFGVAVLAVGFFPADVRAQVYYYPVHNQCAHQCYYPAPQVVTVQPQQISCVPQTVWRQVQVTSYRQVVSVDPWTGQQVIAMRPETTMQWQLQPLEENYGGSNGNPFNPRRDRTYGAGPGPDVELAGQRRRITELQGMVMGLNGTIDRLNGTVGSMQHSQQELDQRIKDLDKRLTSKSDK